MAELLGQTVVALTNAGHALGSGCLVAPQLVLTCARVVRVGTGASVDVGWQGRTIAATVRYASPPARDRRWPYPDLAVLGLDEPLDHPCAWLDPRRLVQISGPELLVVGHLPRYRADFARSSAVLTVEGPHEVEAGQMYRVAGREISADRSGGPALNLATGGVCGLVRVPMPETETDCLVTPLRTPLRGLRNRHGMDPALYRRLWRTHDLYHATCNEWARAVEALVPPTAGELDAKANRELRSLVATLPRPTTTLRGLRTRPARCTHHR